MNSDKPDGVNSDLAALRLHYATLGLVSAALSGMGPDGDIANAVRYLGQSMASLSEAIETAQNEAQENAMSQALGLLAKVGSGDQAVREFLSSLGYVPEGAES